MYRARNCLPLDWKTPLVARQTHTVLAVERPFLLISLVLLALALALLPLRVATLLVIGTGGMLLVIRRPWLAWVGLAVALPFSSGIRFAALSVTDLILAAALGIWFADGVRRRRLRLDPVPLAAIVALYWALLLLATPGAVDLAEAWAEVIKWTEVLLTVWVVGQSLSPGQKQGLVVGLLLGGALQGLLGIYQFIFQIGPDAFVLLDRFMRAAGTFDQPNPYAGYLGLTLPVAVSLALWAWQRLAALTEPAPAQRRNLLWALYTSTAVAVIGLGLLASWSRGGWLGALAGAGVIIACRSRRALLSILAGGLLLLMAVLVSGLNPSLIPAPILQRMADVPAYFGVGVETVVNQPITDENFSVIERLAHWIAALRMWEQSPWLGVGPGNYAAVYPEVRLPLWEEPLGHAHNIYLNVLGETGLAVYLLLWTGIVVWLVRRLRSVPMGSWTHALLVGVLGIVAHLTVHNFFDNLYVRGMYLHVALWLAVAVAERQDS